MYLLGMLNNSTTYFLFRSILPKLRGDFYEPSYVYFKEFPIRTIDFSDPADVARHDRMVSLVERMLSLHKQLPEAGTPHERTALQRQIEATDGQIDRGQAVRADGRGDSDCRGGKPGKRAGESH